MQQAEKAVYIHTCNQSPVVCWYLPTPPDNLSTSSKILSGISIPGILKSGAVAELCVTAVILWEGQQGAELTWKANSTTASIPAEWFFSAPPWGLSLLLMRTLTALIPSCCCLFFPLVFLEYQTPSLFLPLTICFSARFFVSSFGSWCNWL